MDYAGYAKKDIEIYLKNIRRHCKGMLGAAPRGVADHLHQIRVNARRLRNALSIYKDLFLPRQLKQWNKSIRRAVEVSSRARDLDVYIHFLNVYAPPLAPPFGRASPGLDEAIGRGGPFGGRLAARLASRAKREGGGKPRRIPERGVLVSFIAALKKGREKLQPRIIRALDDLNKRDTLADITRSLGRALAADRPPAFAASLAEGGLPSGGKKENNPRKIYKVARKKLLRRVRGLMVFEPFVYQPRHRRGQPRRIQELHQMRIAAKHLRYTLEGFSPIYGPRLPLFVERVVSFQRQLGDIHDYDVWTQHLARYARVKSRSRHEEAVLSKVKRHCLDLRQKTYRAFVRNWSRAREGKFFEDLMEYVYAH